MNETEGRKLALQRGANVVMPNFTPAQYRRYYEIYPNKKRIEVSSVDFKRELEELAVSLGRYIAEAP
jgi:biotin synthase